MLQKLVCNQFLSFFSTNCQTKTKEPVLFTTYTLQGEKTDGFMPFPEELMQSER